MELETERLRIRSIEAGDWSALAEYVTREDVMRYDRPWPTSEAALQEAVATLAAMGGFWGICERDTGRLIGHVMCRRSGDPELATWDIGIGLHPIFQRRGHATEACRCVLAYVFGAQRARRVVASCDPRNELAWRLLERLGFRREAHHREACFLRRSQDGSPIWVDAYEYALLAPEWRERAAG